MNKLQWNFNRNTKIFIQENACENIVCEMAAILPRGDKLINTPIQLDGDLWRSVRFGRALRIALC